GRGRNLEISWFEHQAVKTVICARFCIASVKIDRAGTSAYLAPILDLTREDLSDLIEIERFYGVLGRDQHHDTVQSENMALKFDSGVCDCLHFFGFNLP